MLDVHQTVPGTSHRDDVIATAAISSELTPQVHDVNAQVGPRLALSASIPQHAFGQVAIRVELARRTRQRRQQAELGRRQRQFAIMESRLALGDVDDEVIKAQDILRLTPPP